MCIAAAAFLGERTVLAQGNEIVMRQQTARSLNGVVTGGGTELAGVEVEECSANFKECFPVGHSDKNGRFNVSAKHSGKVFYLRFLLPGFDLEEETVTVDRLAGELKVNLAIGN